MRWYIGSYDFNGVPDYFNADQVDELHTAVIIVEWELMDAIEMWLEGE